ncbi:hypothetical protein CBR_g46305 [Chara braunii]|uniref:RRM domain-containing protein n=1 Tax=Chara braunii TaxID=69332 RepID=A0A388M048_CHABU|nr:hypothetical protein CBR_g46305 [Chara braunii]|eukprot:GBG87938.1 hypothetical protein CBR_g46305 [Chara braunii]
MGFALFSSATLALAARDALQNLVFDVETNSVLRAEMAKKNLYVKRAYDASKRLRTGGDFTAPPFPPPPSFVAAAPAWGPPSYIAPAPTYDPYAYAHPVGAIVPAAPARYAPVQNTKDNPPCNTLFIGNLGEMTSESELRSLFSSQPGFRQMKVLRQAASTVCFVEFVDINSAMLVHTNLQGAVLSTMYSKNPFGKKRDGMAGSGSPGGTPPPGGPCPNASHYIAMGAANDASAGGAANGVSVAAMQPQMKDER